MKLPIPQEILDSLASNDERLEKFLQELKVTNMLLAMLVANWGSSMEAEHVLDEACSAVVEY